MSGATLASAALGPPAGRWSICSLSGKVTYPQRVVMIFPVIEAVATVMYRPGKKARSKEKPPVRLLRELRFEYPHLVWEMYRHTLMHNDEMASASYRGRQVAWSIGIGTGHSWQKGHLLIDVAKLYTDFLEFLARRTADPRSQKVYVWVKEFRFNSAFGRATRNEALQLGKS